MTEIISKHLLVSFVIASLVIATTPRRILAADCKSEIQNPSIIDMDCGCSALGATCVGSWIDGHGGWWECTGGSPVGTTDCTFYPPAINYVSTAPCISSLSAGGATLCVLATIAATGVDLGVCYTLGVLTFSTACIATIVVTTGAMDAACNFCAIHDCDADAAHQVDSWVIQGRATGGVCPNP